MPLLQEEKFIEQGRVAVREYIKTLHKTDKTFLKANLLAYRVITHKMAGEEQIAIYEVSYLYGYEEKDIFTYKKFDEDEQGTVTYYKYVCEVDG